MIVALATAPYPCLQLSLISTNGGNLYPDPPSVNFAPMTLAVVPLIAPISGTAMAPDPPPPKIVHVGALQFVGGPV